MFTRENVGQLRHNLQHIPHNAGIYQWWFLEADAKRLLEPMLTVTDESKIKKENIHNQSYWLMYFGIANKSLNQRAKWHILQHHSASAVKSGYLSTLRVTLSALLQKPQSQTEQEVNEILDRCYWEWQLDENPKKTECVALSQGYFPLNIKGNKELDQTILKELRKEYKK